MINPDARPNTDQDRFSFEIVRPENIPEVAVQWPQWKQEYRDAGLTNEYQRMEMDL